ncbi:MAG: SRPBCC domain-containing protein [Pseudonocardia sp.]|nr:SRPBCC domain-containing protein [Pseudonocardia sp.]
MPIVDDEFVHEVRIEAAPEVVFRYFTDADRHTRWLGRRATLDPRPGGVYRCAVNDTVTIVGEYLHVEPPKLVVFTWGFDGDAAVPPGSSTVTVTLTPDAEATLLRLVHTGLPHPALAPHGKGWAGYLNTLAGCVSSDPVSARRRG